MTAKWGQNLAKNVPVFNLGHALSLGNFYTKNGHNKLTLDCLNRELFKKKSALIADFFWPLMAVESSQPEERLSLPV